MVIDRVDYPCGVRPPQASGASDDEDRFAGANWCVAWECFEPAEIELLPALEGCFGVFERGRTLPKLNAGVIDGKGRGNCGGGRW